MQMIFRLLLSLLLALQLSFAGAVPSHAHVSGEISQEGYRATTYNLTVAKAHTFFIGEEQIWVHNVGPCDVINNALKGRSNIKTVTSADARKYGLQKSSGSNTLYDPVTQVNYAVGKDGLIYEVSSLSGFNPIPLSKPLTSAPNKTLTNTDFGDVASFFKKNGALPDNFITKSDAKKLGWIPKKGNLADVAPGKSIGGDVFKNNEGLLPSTQGRVWREADINYTSGTRNSERFVYSSDGLIYKSTDHYKTFTKIE